MSLWPASLFTDAAERLDRRYGWDRLPWPLGLITLIGLRNRLRARNLYDTGRGTLGRPDISDHPRYLTARTVDGTFNDLDDPLMGSLGSRFGRNVPLEATVREPEDDGCSSPARARVSRELLTRSEFQPATTLNLLAGGVDPVRGPRLVQPRYERDTEPGGSSRSTTDDPWPEHPMPIERTRRGSRARTPTGRRPSSPTTPTGGTARRSTVAIPTSPPRSARAWTAS